MTKLLKSISTLISKLIRLSATLSLGLVCRRHLISIVLGCTFAGTELCPPTRRFGMVVILVEGGRGSIGSFLSGGCWCFQIVSYVQSYDAGRADRDTPWEWVVAVGFDIWARKRSYWVKHWVMSYKKHGCLQLLSVILSSRKRTAQNMLFLLRYRGWLSGLSMSVDMWEE